MRTALLLALALYSFQLSAQWQAFVPNIPGTVGVQALDAVDEQIAWAVAVKYIVDSTGYQLAGDDTGYFFRTTDGYTGPGPHISLRRSRFALGGLRSERTLFDQSFFCQRYAWRIGIL